MKRLPIQARSAPSISAAATWWPWLMAPASSTVPSKNWRISLVSAKGLVAPECPPAPAHTAISPSTPASAALCAWRIDHVVEHHAAVAVHRLHQVRHRAERSDDERHLVLHAGREVGLEAGIGAMHDQVHAPGRMRSRPARAARTSSSQLDELRRAALVECRKGCRHAALAGLDDQLRPGDQEHRRRHRRHRDAETAGRTRQSPGAGPGPWSGRRSRS